MFLKQSHTQVDFILSYLNNITISSHLWENEILCIELMCLQPFNNNLIVNNSFYRANILPILWVNKSKMLDVGCEQFCKYEIQDYAYLIVPHKYYWDIEEIPDVPFLGYQWK